MRLPVTAALLAPASAHAGTVALEGTELVPSAHGRLDDLLVMPEPGVVTFATTGPRSCTKTFAYVRTRSGGDRGLVHFSSRVG